MKNTNNCIDYYMEQKHVGNIAVCVGQKDEIVFTIYKSDGQGIDSNTLFDMASVTKIMATTTLALIAMDRKMINDADLVGKFFLVPEYKKKMAVHNLLTHTMGIGNKNLCKEANTYDNIHNFILNIPSDVSIGSEVLYSCPGYILLGKILEKVLDERLDKLFARYVAQPLDLINTGFLPDRNNKFVNSNLSDEEIGTVNDFNCKFLGGVAGNAGLFSNMADVNKYVKMLLNYGYPLISENIFITAIENQTSLMSESRGLGFVYVDEKYKQTGKLFEKGSIGHCGHTGQSVFVDLKSGLYVIILSDATISIKKKYSNERYDIVKKMREDIHNAITMDINY